MTDNKTRRGRPMSARVKRKREDIRQEILAVAREVLEAEGIEAVTLAAVAGRLQLTKQALYHYFRSKEVLVKALTASLLKDEIEYVVAEVDKAGPGKKVLETMIRAFYAHYINHLGAFRTVYCQGQLQAGAPLRMDEEQIKTEVNPRTRHLFDVLEEKMASPGMTMAQRKEIRRLAFTAWMSVLGMLTIRSLTEALNDPLIHTDKALLDTLCGVFNEAVTGRRQGRPGN